MAQTPLNKAILMQQVEVELTKNCPDINDKAMRLKAATDFTDHLRLSISLAMLPREDYHDVLAFISNWHNANTHQLKCGLCGDTGPEVVAEPNKVYRASCADHNACEDRRMAYIKAVSRG